MPSWKLLLIVALVVMVSSFVALVVMYQSVKIPPTDAQALSQAAIITYSDGEVMARLGTPNRQNVKLAQVPQSVRDAVLAAEDRTFYANHGVDPKSIARALISNARGGSQGGSTISQQYVKNVYNQRERTFKRKFNEVFLAVKINRQISKDAILERYLNTIYLGRGAFGMQAAAQAYFHRDVGELTVSQGAFLAGIINAPALADPREGADQRQRAQRRWGVVLDALVKDGRLDAGTRAGLRFPTTVKPDRDGVLKGQNGYLVSMAQAEVQRKLHLTEAQFRSGGYKIVTTFDKSMIQAGVAAVENSLPADKPKRLKIGLTAIDPGTGAVRALYGGHDFLKRQQNTATQDTAEAAGTFTTFALLAGLKAGMSPGMVFNGSTPIRVGPEVIHNYRARQYGDIDLIEATKESVNTVFAQVSEKIGPERTRAAAHAAGIPKSVEISGSASNALGVASPHTIDLAGAYATLAAEGVRRTPYVVQSVTRIGTNQELLQMNRSRTKGARVFPADVVADTTFALQQVVQGGTGSYARLLKRPAAGQTGTSASARSAWFVGYTPQLATAVSMYQLSRNGREIERMKGFGPFPSITGGGYPTRIWTTFMADALKGESVAALPRPAFVRVAQPDPKSIPLDKDRSIGLDDATDDQSKADQLKADQLRKEKLPGRR